MSKQHKTILNEPEEMPREQQLSEIEQPKDPRIQEIPDESPDELPDELPPDETK